MTPAQLIARIHKLEDHEFGISQECQDLAAKLAQSLDGWSVKSEGDGGIVFVKGKKSVLVWAP